jgi:hypothetical protein
MTQGNKPEFRVDQKFDPKSCRHTANGVTSVLHCHHFATLYSQLADDAEFVDGKALLRRSAEMSFLPVLSNYFTTGHITKMTDRLALVEEYWKFIGMGTLSFEKVGNVSTTVRMAHSHVDEGWIKKWGPREQPVNFLGQGFLAAAMAAVYDLPAGSFAVRETQSLVSGADASLFTIVRA